MSSESDQTKLIINYLPQSMTNDELFTIFSKCGPLSSVKIIRDAVSNYSFGYGFVEYVNADDAANAICQLKGYPVLNKRLGVAYARAHDREALKDTNLYIANIPSSHCNEEALRQLFAPYGRIINLKILQDEKTNNARGTAFVRYDRKEEARDAIAHVHGKQLPDSSKRLMVKVSEEHGKMKAARPAQLGPPHHPAGHRRGGGHPPMNAPPYPGNYCWTTPSNLNNGGYSGGGGGPFQGGFGGNGGPFQGGYAEGGGPFRGGYGGGGAYQGGNASRAFQEGYGSGPNRGGYNNASAPNQALNFYGDCDESAGSEDKPRGGGPFRGARRHDHRSAGPVGYWGRGRGRGAFQSNEVFETRWN